MLADFSPGSLEGGWSRTPSLPGPCLGVGTLEGKVHVPKWPLPGSKAWRPFSPAACLHPVRESPRRWLILPP